MIAGCLSYTALVFCTAATEYYPYCLNKKSRVLVACLRAFCLSRFLFFVLAHRVDATAAATAAAIPAIDLCNKDTAFSFEVAVVAAFNGDVAMMHIGNDIHGAIHPMDQFENFIFGR